MATTRSATQCLLTVAASAAMVIAASSAAVADLPPAAPSPSASMLPHSSATSSASPSMATSSQSTPPSSAASVASVASSVSVLPAQSVRPFGPGHPVEISCDKPWAYAYVAQGVVDTRPSFPDPFVKVGRLPITIELPSGVYTLIVEGDAVSSGSAVFEVRAMPAHVKVKAGSSSLRELSSYALALGGTSLLAAIALQLSWTSHQDTHMKNALSIPLFIVGGVGVASGVTMFLVSSTRIQTDAFVPDQTKPGAVANPTLNIAGWF